MDWIKKLKIAIIQKDLKKFETLIESVPNFTKQSDIKQAEFLLREASKTLTQLRDETGESMQKLKKSITMLRSVEKPTPHRLDIKL